VNSGRLVYLLSGEHLVRIDVDGRNERELYQAPQGRRTTFALSPDERTISIVTMVSRDGRALLLMSSDGGTPRQIHEFENPSGGGVSHVWTPDGKSILYIVNRVIHKVPVEGGETPEVSFERKNLFHGPRFHPNGRLVAFTGRNGASSGSEVWVIENLRDELELIASSSDSR